MENRLEVEYRPVADLIPYARNARTHSEEQVARIAASIREFGWTNPILVDGANGIIAGHGRLAAARLLKMDTVPVIELAGMTDAQKKAYDKAYSDAERFTMLQEAADKGYPLEIYGLALCYEQGIGVTQNAE